MPIEKHQQYQLLLDLPSNSVPNGSNYLIDLIIACLQL